MSERLALEEFQGKVLETAYRLTAYSLYGGKKTNAIRALARRCPGWKKGEIENWLDRGIAVQESARAWLKENQEAIHELYRNNKSVELISSSFHEAHSDWPNHELDVLLAINFLYFHLM